MKPLGTVYLEVEFKRISKTLKLMKGGGPPILGRNFLNVFGIKLHEINFIEPQNAKRRINAIAQEFPGVSLLGLGHFNEGVLKINLKDEDVTPKFLGLGSCHSR